MFAFSLDTGSENNLITSIGEVRNLESNRSNIGYRKLRLINVQDTAKLKYEIEKAALTYDHNGFIHMLDANGSIIHSTFISSISIGKSKRNTLCLSGYVWFKPKGFQKSLQMYLDNEISGKDCWKKLNRDELQGWLVFALHITKPGPDRENLFIRIDGSRFHNEDGFYCTLGEEIHGSTGYFGRNKGALTDCLRGSFGVKSISEITWVNHQRSKKLLKRNFTDIIAIFESFDVRVMLK